MYGHSNSAADKDECIYTILYYLCKDVKKYIMKILRCSSIPLTYAENLVVSDHTHHVILILKAAHRDISLKLFSFYKTNCAVNSISSYLV